MNKDKFFNSIRGGFTGKLEPGEVKGTEAILVTFAGQPIAWTACGLATAWHETAGTMQPIHEYGGERYFFNRYDPFGSRPDIAKRLGNIKRGDGALYAGRGYPQLTGRRNYTIASEKLGVDLVNAPNLALDPKVAADIMLRGMTEGWFTGRKFSSYLPSKGGATFDSHMAARRIINGVDKARDIARYAVAYQDALAASGWA